MVSACVLIRCEAGKVLDVASLLAVAERIRGFEGVKTAFPVLGRWDVVVELEAPTIEALTATVLKINELSGVKDTETIVEAKYR